MAHHVPALPAPQPANIPADEADRIAALRRLCLLDSKPSASFDRITRQAARALDVPIVLVSLVEDTRQWFLSRVGLNAAETSREVSFCAHAVYERSTLVVPDATLDTRFAGNPLVTGDPHIRAYGGIPLFTRDGYALGTLCAIDRRPRDFDAEDIATLRDFALMVEDFIHGQELAIQSKGVLDMATEHEMLFRATFEQAAVGIVHASPSGIMVRINQCALRMLGYAMDELLHKSFIDITHPDDIGGNTDLLQQLVAGDIGSYRVEKRYTRKDGTSLWAYLSVVLKRSSHGAPEYLIAVIEDLSAIKQAEAMLLNAKTSLETQVLEQTKKIHASNEALRVHLKRLLESEASVRRVEHRLRAIADSLPALVGYWNRSLRCEFANKTYVEWFGLPLETIIGMNMRDLLGDVHFAAAEPYTREALAGHAQQFERQMVKPTGGEVFVEVRYMPDCDEAGHARGFFVLVTDVTTSRHVQRALEGANIKLANDSATDYLTGIANRREFSERSEEALRRARKHDERYGLILLDLDNFKGINDVFGHDAGDEVLRCVGRLLKGQLRSHRDVAARLGGEEFGMLCFGHLDEDLLVQVAERIRSLIDKESIKHEKGILKFTGSFGLGLSSPADGDWRAIYSRADSALYQAKAAGKDRVVFGAAASDGATGRFRSQRLVTSK